MKENNYQNNTGELLNEITKNGKLEIKDLIQSKYGDEWSANKILESCKGFQSMLFITPPKLHDIQSPIASPSPLLDIMHSLNSLIIDDEERK